MTAEERAELRAKAEAAREQLTNGPREWPGRPSRQRLELFLVASPDAVLDLLDERDELARQLEGKNHADHL